MIPTQFDYEAPASLADAVKLLDRHEDSLVLAGSYSLIEEIKQGHISPSLLIDLKKISGLQGISCDNNGVLRLGGMTTYDQVANDAQVKHHYEALAEVALSVGDAQIRNWQRIGDVSAYRDLASGFTAVALVLDATFEVLDVQGSRSLKAQELIKLAAGGGWLPRAILEAIAFPALASGTGTSYEFLKNPASHAPICAIAAWVEPSTDGVNVAQCRVAVAGASSYAIRLHNVEDALKGKAPTAENIAAAAQGAADNVISLQSSNQGLNIVGDLYASAEYRTHLIGVLTKRALSEAVKRANFKV